MAFYKGWDVISLYDAEVHNVDYIVGPHREQVNLERLIYRDASDRAPGDLREIVDGLCCQPDKINILVVLWCRMAIFRAALQGTTPVKLNGPRAFSEYLAQKCEQWESREVRKRTAQQAGLLVSGDVSPTKRVAGTVLAPLSGVAKLPPPQVDRSPPSPPRDTNGPTSLPTSPVMARSLSRSKRVNMFMPSRAHPKPAATPNSPRESPPTPGPSFPASAPLAVRRPTGSAPTSPAIASASPQPKPLPSTTANKLASPSPNPVRKSASAGRLLAEVQKTLAGRRPAEDASAMKIDGTDQNTETSTPPPVEQKPSYAPEESALASVPPQSLRLDDLTQQFLLAFSHLQSNEPHSADPKLVSAALQRFARDLIGETADDDREVRQELERVKGECEGLQLQLRLERERVARLRDEDAKSREATQRQVDADIAATRAQLEELRTAQAATARSLAESSKRFFEAQAADAERIEALEALASKSATDLPLVKAKMSKYDQATRDRVKGYITTARESITNEIRIAVAAVSPAEDPSVPLIETLKRSIEEYAPTVAEHSRVLETLSKAVRELVEKCDHAETVANGASRSVSSHRGLVNSYKTTLDTLADDVKTLSELDTTNTVTQKSFAPLSVSITSLDARIAKLAGEFEELDKAHQADLFVTQTQCEALENQVLSKVGRDDPALQASMSALVDSKVAQAIAQWEGSAKLAAGGKLDAFKLEAAALVTERLAELAEPLSASSKMHKVVGDLQSGFALHESRLLKVEANMTEVVTPHIERVTQAFAMPARTMKMNPVCR